MGMVSLILNIAGVATYFLVIMAIVIFASVVRE